MNTRATGAAVVGAQIAVITVGGAHALCAVCVCNVGGTVTVVVELIVTGSGRRGLHACGTRRAGITGNVGHARGQTRRRAFADTT